MLNNFFFRCAFASLQASNASISVVKREGVPPFTTLIEALEAWEAKSYCDFQTTMSTSVPLTCGHKEDRYNYKGRGVCKHDVCKGKRDAKKKRKKEANQAESNSKRQKIQAAVETAAAVTPAAAVVPAAVETAAAVTPAAAVATAVTPAAAVATAVTPAAAVATAATPASDMVLWVFAFEIYCANIRFPFIFADP